MKQKKKFSSTYKGCHVTAPAFDESSIHRHQAAVSGSQFHFTPVTGMMGMAGLRDGLTRTTPPALASRHVERRPLSPPSPPSL